MNHLSRGDQKRLAKHIIKILPNNPFTLEPWTVSEVLRCYAKAACRSFQYSVSKQDDLIQLHHDLQQQFIKDNKLSPMPSMLKKQAPVY